MSWPYGTSAYWYAKAREWYHLGLWDMACVAQWIAWRRWLNERNIDGERASWPPWGLPNNGG